MARMGVPPADAAQLFTGCALSWLGLPEFGPEALGAAPRDEAKRAELRSLNVDYPSRVRPEGGRGGRRGRE